MDDDRQLLRRYAKDGSEAAFGELVARHVNLVIPPRSGARAATRTSRRTWRNWSSPT